MTACGAIGALIVGGRVVGELRCELSAGHRRECQACRWHDDFGSRAPLEHDHPEAHRMTLEWAPEAEPDLDLFDPDEHFDVTVEIPTSGPCAVSGCVLESGHGGLHEHYVLGPVGE